MAAAETPGLACCADDLWWAGLLALALGLGQLPALVAVPDWAFPAALPWLVATLGASPAAAATSAPAAAAEVALPVGADDDPVPPGADVEVLGLGLPEAEVDGEGEGDVLVLVLGLPDGELLGARKELIPGLAEQFAAFEVLLAELDEPAADVPVPCTPLLPPGRVLPPPPPPRPPLRPLPFCDEVELFKGEPLSAT